MIHVADAVAELIRQQTLRIHYLPGAPDRYYTARAPSLLDQLADAVGSSNNGRGGRTVPGPRLPVSADAIDLWYRIKTTTYGWAQNLGVDRHGPLPGLLRRVGAAVVDHEDMARLVRRRCWCGTDDIAPEDCRSCWTHRIRTLLTPTLADRELRGASCWTCKTRTDAVDSDGKTTEVWQPTTTVVLEEDGEHYRAPAVVVRVAQLPDLGPTDLWIYRMCRACGAEGWLDYTTTTAA